MTHDQNFKNLILDYPRAGVAVHPSEAVTRHKAVGGKRQ